MAQPCKSTILRNQECQIWKRSYQPSVCLGIFSASLQEASLKQSTQTAYTPHQVLNPFRPPLPSQKTRFNVASPLSPANHHFSHYNIVVSPLHCYPLQPHRRFMHCPTTNTPSKTTISQLKLRHSQQSYPPTPIAKAISTTHPNLITKPSLFTSRIVKT